MIERARDISRCVHGTVTTPNFLASSVILVHSAVFRVARVVVVDGVFDVAIGAWANERNTDIAPSQSDPEGAHEISKQNPSAHICKERRF